MISYILISGAYFALFYLINKKTGILDGLIEKFSHYTNFNNQSDAQSDAQSNNKIKTILHSDVASDVQSEESDIIVTGKKIQIPDEIDPFDVEYSHSPAKGICHFLFSKNKLRSQSPNQSNNSSKGSEEGEYEDVDDETQYRIVDDNEIEFQVIRIRKTDSSESSNSE